MKQAILVFLSFILLNCQSKNHELEAIQLDIESNTKDLSLFGENVISTPLYERDLAISPQGDQLIYTLGDYKQNRRSLIVLNREKNNWTAGEILNISGEYQDIEPFFSRNGGRLYFASNRPIYDDESRKDYNIWFSDKIDGLWSSPIPLDSVINTRGDEFYPSLSAKGNLFFTATRDNGIGREDIFISKFENGKFQTPTPLPKEINSTLFEFNAYVNPDENLLIFSSFGREDDLGGGDLYISRKDDKGNWTKSKNLGKMINSNKLDYCPFIDWRTRKFYFTSERSSIEDKKFDKIDQLKQLANRSLNGFGNIYTIGLDELD